MVTLAQNLLSSHPQRRSTSDDSDESQVRTHSTQSIWHWPSLHVQFSLTRLISGQLNWGTVIREADLLFRANVNHFNQWRTDSSLLPQEISCICMAVTCSCTCVFCKPENCLTVPKTPLPASTCCPGYQSVTKPHVSCFHTSAVPEMLVRKQIFSP